MTAPDLGSPFAATSARETGARRSLVAFSDMGTICADCYGHREHWCPRCDGWDGCRHCGMTGKVRCSSCKGGTAGKG